MTRGKRKKGKSEEEKLDVIEIDPPLVSKELKKRCSYFISKVYETDPLTCPKCQGEMWFDMLLLCGCQAPEHTSPLIFL